MEGKVGALCGGNIELYFCSIGFVEKEDTIYFARGEE